MRSVAIRQRAAESASTHLRAMPHVRGKVPRVAVMAMLMLPAAVTDVATIMHWRMRPMVTEIRTTVSELRTTMTELVTMVSELRTVVAEMVTVVPELWTVVSELMTVVTVVWAMVAEVFEPVIVATELMTVMPELGDMVSELMIVMPELGSMSRLPVAKLMGWLVMTELTTSKPRPILMRTGFESISTESASPAIITWSGRLVIAAS